MLTSTDSHIHLFASGFVEPPTSAAHSDLDDYDALRARWAIGDALVVAYEGESRFEGNNDHVHALARTRPWIRPLAYTGVQSSAAEVGRRLDQGFVGVSAYVTDPLEASAMEQMLRSIAPILSERHAILSLNIVPAHYPVLAGLLDAAPESIVLVSHLGLPAVGAANRDDAVAALDQLCAYASYPGVHVKLSGFYALGPLTRDDAVAPLLEAFGVERLLWGSDFPVVLGSESFEESMAVPLLPGLDKSALELVRGGNLSRLLADVAVIAD